MATATCRIEFAPQNLDPPSDFQGFHDQWFHNAVFEPQGAITDLLQGCVALQSRQPQNLARSRGNRMPVFICHQTGAERVAFNPNRFSRRAIGNGNDLRTGCTTAILQEALNNQSIAQIGHLGNTDRILGKTTSNVHLTSLSGRPKSAENLGEFRPVFRTGGSNLWNKHKRYDRCFDHRPCPGFTSFSSIALAGSRYICASTFWRLTSERWRSVSTIAPIMATSRIRPASWNSRKYWS